MGRRHNLREKRAIGVGRRHRQLRARKTLGESFFNTLKTKIKCLFLQRMPNPGFEVQKALSGFHRMVMARD